MIRNYLKVAFRNILRHKFFSAINILGMTVGVSACLLISLYILDELSYDRFHPRADRMYEVGLHGRIGGQDIMTATTCPPMADAFANEIPGIEATTRIANYWGAPVVKYNDKSFKEEKVFYADSNFFDFFGYRLLEGDPKKVLLEPNSIVLAKSIATKYFGNEPAIGKTVALGGENTACKITGIAEDSPSNSSFRYTILLSSSSGKHLKSTQWLNNYLHTYFILDKSTALSSVEPKFKDMVIKYVGPELSRFVEGGLEAMEKNGGAYGYFATAVPDIHLRSVTRDTFEPAGNITYVYLFAAIGAFIVAIACINFMNISTARSAGRAKEVGLRKTLGSLRGQMIGQFLSESIFYSVASFILSLVVCYFLLPQFNLLGGKNLTMAVLMQPTVIISILVLALVVGLVAGSYPAFYLTSFSAVEVLKGKVRAGMRSKGVRSALVVFQFALSIFLIIFTAVVYQQISYMQDRNLGIDKHNVIIINSSDRVGNDHREAFKNILGQQTGIVKTSYTNNSFPGVNNTTVFKAAGSEQDHMMGVYYADYDHMDVMKFELNEGRYFSRDFPSDSTAILLNEAAVKEFGYEHPLQEEVIFNDDNQHQKLKIVGVIKDFNFESLKMKVRPLAIRLTKESDNLMVRYEGNPKEALATVERVWKQYAASEPLDYGFLDQSFDELFRSEQRMGTLFSVFSGLAIFIACLGLFALAAFTAEQRTKEIGIRKAMGASVSGLTMMISREFTILVLIAFGLVAGPTWFIVKWWLEGFAYRVELQPWVFLMGGLVSIIVAWLTVSYQSLKAASINPVTSLRYE